MILNPENLAFSALAQALRDRDPFNDSLSHIGCDSRLLQIPTELTVALECIKFE